MAASHVIWRGHLKLSLVDCPIRLYSATSATERIRLHLINKRTGNRVRQCLRDAETGEEIQRRDTVRGYEVDRDHYVVLDEKDLETAEKAVASSHLIELDRFVAEIDDLYFDTSYWLVPDGAVAEETYRVIVEALKSVHKLALGKITLASRERSVVVRPRGEGLLATTLRAANEVQAAPIDFDTLAKHKIDKEMVELAAMIMDRKKGPLEVGDFEDSYQTALRRIIQAKAKGQAPKIAAQPRSAQVIDLMSALKRSLEGGRPGRGGPARSEKRKPPAKRARRSG